MESTLFERFLDWLPVRIIFGQAIFVGVLPAYFLIIITSLIGNALGIYIQSRYNAMSQLFFLALLLGFSIEGFATYKVYHYLSTDTVEEVSLGSF